MPTWARESELWMQRMIEALEPSVTRIAAYAPAESHWQGRIPTVALAPAWWRRANPRGAPLAWKGMGERVLRETLVADAIDVVLCHYVNFALRFERVWRQNATPLFVHCHGYDVTWDLRLAAWPYPRRFPRGYLGQIRRLADRATLIANSHFTRNRLLAAGLPPERVVVKHLGVPVPGEFPQRRPAPKRLSILHLGRLVDFKAPQLTIRAFDLACRQGLDATLTLAGGGPLAKACRQARRDALHPERIRLVGAVDAAAGQRLRAAADIFTAHNCVGAVSGQEEAFGVSILEAMADGLPVVTGRSGGVVETVVHEQTGLLFAPGDVEAHAEALLALARNPQLRRHYGHAGWQRAGDHFSLGHESQRLRQILGSA